MVNKSDVFPGNKINILALCQRGWPSHVCSSHHRQMTPVASRHIRVRVHRDTNSVFAVLQDVLTQFGRRAVCWRDNCYT